MENGQENVLSISDKIALKELIIELIGPASSFVNPCNSLIFYRKKFWQKCLRFLVYIILGFALVFCFLSLYAFNGTFAPLKALLIYTATPKFYTYFTFVLVVLGFLRLWTRFFKFRRIDIISIIFAFIVYLIFITMLGSEVVGAFKGHEPAKIIAIFKDANLFTTLRFVVGLSMFYALWSWLSKSKKGAEVEGSIEREFSHEIFKLPHFLQVHYHVKKINKEYELENNISESQALTAVETYLLTGACYEKLKEMIDQNYLSVEKLKELLYSSAAVDYKEGLLKSR